MDSCGPVQQHGYYPMIEKLTIATVLPHQLGRTIKNENAIQAQDTSNIIISYNELISSRQQAAACVDLTNYRITFIGLTESAILFRYIMGIPQQVPQQIKDTSTPLYQNIQTPIIAGTPCFRIMEYKCKKPPQAQPLSTPSSFTCQFDNETYELPAESTIYYKFRPAINDFVFYTPINHSQKDVVLIIGYCINNQVIYPEITQIFEAVTEEIIPPKISRPQLQPLYQWQNAKRILLRIDNQATACMQVTFEEIRQIKLLMVLYQFDYFTRINLDNPKSIAAFHTMLLLLSYEASRTLGKQ
jgi:hypothetical protein